MILEWVWGTQLISRQFAQLSVRYETGWNHQRSSSRPYRFATLIKAKHHIVRHIQTECYTVYDCRFELIKNLYTQKVGCSAGTLNPKESFYVHLLSEQRQISVKKCAAVFYDNMFRFFAAVLVGSLVMVSDCSPYHGWVHSVRD